MKMKITAVAMSVLGIATHIAVAQIGYRIDNGPTVLLNTATNTIDVGAIPTSTTRLLCIFDTTGIDESVTGQIVIQGSVGTNSDLRIQVTDANAGNVFAPPRTPRDFLFPGLRDFGGLTFSNNTLRDHSILALAIRGDITGDIDAGQVWRIDVRSDAPNTFGGHIYGNITAHKPDNAVIAGAPSIGYVRASNGIGPNALTGGTADIKAIGEEDALGRITARANISRVIIGPNIASTPAPPDAGLQGNVIGRVASK